MIKNNGESEEEKKLGIYIHIPFCVRKCNYCDFLSMPARESLQDRYMETLLKEITADAEFYRGYEADTVFIGGGTPSVLKEDWIGKLLLTLRNCFSIRQDAEISMEINPGTVTADKMKAYAGYGINRISIGMQATDNSVLKRLGRIHTYEDFLKAYEWTWASGIRNMNVDVMSALPGQTYDGYCHGLEMLMNLPVRPVHISSYSLILEEGTPFFELYGTGNAEQLPPEYRLPDEDTEREMYDATDDILKDYGYHRYEISNYAIPGFECRHNRKYWTRDEYVGFGIGAASLIGTHRFKNSSDLEAYIREDGHPEREEDFLLSVRDQMEEFMFLGLRLTGGVSRKKFEREFGISMEKVYGKEIGKLKEQGLLTEEKNLCLTKRGIDVSNYVFEEFLE